MTNVVEYELLEQIGSGSFGSVYKAKVSSGKYDGQMVAVIDVQDFVDKRGRRNYDLIFELMDKNLREYVHVQEMKGTLRAKDIKVLMHQLCIGVSYLHSHTVMHRDLKPDNVLLDSSLHLKIADFGCGRQFTVPTDKFSGDALYSGYKAPEGLLFLNNYTASTDMWSVGCIFAYLASGTEHFKPQNPRTEPLDLIFSSMGTPTDDDWPGITKHINGRARNYPRKSLPKSWFKDLDNDGYDLLKKMLCYDPSKRISALESYEACLFP